MERKHLSLDQTGDETAVQWSRSHTDQGLCTLACTTNTKVQEVMNNGKECKGSRLQIHTYYIIFFLFFFIIYKDKPLQALGLEALFVNQKLYSVRSGNLSLKQQCLCSQCCKQATGCAKGIFTQGWHIHRFMNISLNAIKVLGALLLAS